MTLSEIVKIQKSLKDEMRLRFEKDDISCLIKLIDTFADFTQGVNNIFRDDDIEFYLSEISKKCIGEVYIESHPSSNTIVFYDQVGTTVCLGLQYLRGLRDNSFKIIYIFENYYSKISNTLLNEVKNITDEYYIFDSSCPFKNGCYLGLEIANLISSKSPFKLIVHPQATGALGMTIMYSLKNIEILRIVPGDHHFIIGINCFDKFLEFRDFGYQNDIFGRRLDPNQILRLSFYPIVDDFTEFKGFPINVQGKVIIGTAGTTYKFLGSNLFYEIAKYILTYENAIIVYMGKASERIRDFIREGGYEKKFLLLGYRKDFSACIKNIDILLASYPFTGGLVCQTAAFYKKPIISFSSEIELPNLGVDDILGNSNNENFITKSSLESLFQYIDKLMLSKNFRIKEGASVYSKLQTQSNFTTILGCIMNDSKDISCNFKPISYEDFVELSNYYTNLYLKINNMSKPLLLFPIIKNLRLGALKYVLICWRDFLKHPVYCLKFLFL